MYLNLINLIIMLLYGAIYDYQSIRSRKSPSNTNTWTHLYANKQLKKKKKKKKEH